MKDDEMNVKKLEYLRTRSKILDVNNLEILFVLRNDVEVDKYNDIHRRYSLGKLIIS